MIMRKVDPEKLIQKRLVYWMQYKFPGILFTICPAGVKRGTKIQRIISGREAKEMGYRKGTPDLIILEPRGQYHGMCLELKTEDGVLSPEQHDFLDAARDRGYYDAVAYGYDDATKILENYMSLKA